MRQVISWKVLHLLEPNTRDSSAPFATCEDATTYYIHRTCSSPELSYEATLASYFQTLEL